MATAIEIILLIVAINIIIISLLYYSCYSWTKIFELARSLIKKITYCCIKKKETQSNPIELTSATRQNGLQEFSSVYNCGILPYNFYEWNREADRRQHSSIMEHQDRIRESRTHQSTETDNSNTGLVVQLPPVQQKSSLPRRLTNDLDLPPSYEQLFGK